MDSAGAEGPDTLPPMPQGKEAGGEGAGAEGPDTPSPAPFQEPSPTASGERALTRNPEGAWRGKTQVPRALRCSHPYPSRPVPQKPGDTGAEGPFQASARGDRSRTAGRTGAEGPEMRQRDHTAYVEGGPPQRPARPLVLAADAIRPLGDGINSTPISC